MKGLDESMSAWRPRTSKNGGVGKEGMKTEKYHGTIPTILGDAWFVSFRAAVEAADSGIECIFQVNSNHGLFPKNFIEEHLSDDPGETHSVLTGTNP